MEQKDRGSALTELVAAVRQLLTADQALMVAFEKFQRSAGPKGLQSADVERWRAKQAELAEPAIMAKRKMRALLELLDAPTPGPPS